MKNVISILKFVNNQVSGESISLGLVAISKTGVFFKVSGQKLQLARKLNAESAKLLDFSVKQLSSYLAHDLEAEVKNPVQFKAPISNSFLDRLSRYNNGLLQFTPPSAVNSEITEDDFNNYFGQFIGREELKVHEPRALYIPSKQEINLESKFISPLSGRIDTHITIKKKQLPSLFFDFPIDGLGVNGSLYVVKSVDLSALKPQGVRANISEYESLLERLIDYSRSKGINGKPVTYLVLDPPVNERSSELTDLYRFMKNEPMPYFQVINSEDLDKVSTEIIQNQARKFSQDLLRAE